MGQIRNFNNGKWTIFTTGEDLAAYTGGTSDTYYVGPNLTDGIYTKVNPDGSTINLEAGSGGTVKTYKVAFALAAFDGEPIPQVIQNDLGFVPTWVRASAGFYQSVMSEWTNKGSKIFISATKSALTPVGYINCSFSQEDSAILLKTYDLNGDLADGLLGDEDQFSRSYVEISLKTD